MKKISTISFLTTLTIIIFAFCFSTTSKIEAATTDNMYGFAWSDNIGWISFNNCVDPSDATTCGGINYGVQYDTNTGDLSGFAWSDNIGWIQFGALAGFPTGPGTTPANATLNLTNGRLTGWARALSLQNPNDTENPTDWADGWISLNGLNPNFSYGVSFDMTTGVANTKSFAWGSQVLGWISFDQVKLNVNKSDECPNIPGPQIVVPDGMITDSAGNCVNPPQVLLQAFDTADSNNNTSSLATLPSPNPDSNPLTINSGSGVELWWGAQDVDYSTCVASSDQPSAWGNIGSIGYTATLVPLSLGGPSINNPTTATTYTVTCQSSDPLITDPVEADITVDVTPVSTAFDFPPPSYDLNCQAQGSVTFNWSGDVSACKAWYVLPDGTTGTNPSWTWGFSSWFIPPAIPGPWSKILDLSIFHPNTNSTPDIYTFYLSCMPASTSTTVFRPSSDPASAPTPVTIHQDVVVPACPAPTVSITGPTCVKDASTPFTLNWVTHNVAPGSCAISTIPASTVSLWDNPSVSISTDSNHPVSGMTIGGDTTFNITCGSVSSTPHTVTVDPSCNQSPNPKIPIFKEN